MSERGKAKFFNLLESGRIGNLEFKNRMIMPAMVTNYANEDGSVNERLLAFYEARATGGVSAVIAEAAYVAPAGKQFSHQLGIDDDDKITGLSRLVKYLLKKECHPLIQLDHKALDDLSQWSAEKKAEIINYYREAARRAVAAGFVGVEIQGSQGTLLAQSFSPLTNSASLEDRMELPLAVAKAVKEVLGADKILLYRLSAMEYVEGGLDLPESLALARELEKIGIDGIDVSAGSNHFSEKVVSPMGIRQGYLGETAAKFKKNTNLPVLVGGRVNEPKIAQRILEDGQSDFILLGRALLADAYFPQKVAKADLDGLRVCIACNQECIARLEENKDICCLINAQVGMERERAIRPVAIKKKVMVIGGGTAGLEAARVAALKGHEVHLYEKRGDLGGKLASVAQAPRKEVINMFKESLIHHTYTAGVKVNLNAEVSEELIDTFKPDVILLTSGSNPNMPPIPGIQGSNVVNADDVLNKKVQTGDKVVVIGNGLVGAETADWLSEFGKKVILLGKAPEIAPGSEAMNKAIMIRAMKRKKVEMINNAGVVEILPDGVRYEIDGAESEIHGMDTIVVALGYKANNKLLDIIKAKNICVYSAGDCIRPRRIAEAIYEAFDVGNSL
ncbi:MAG: FAD-dependent oxidoreductase [bacterium]